MTPSDPQDVFDRFVAEVSTGLAKAGTPEAVTLMVEESLARILPDSSWLAEEHRKPSGEGFTRSLIFRHPELGFAVVATVWSPGQGTPVHDHGGIWGVEGVVEGTVRIRQFNPVSGEEPAGRIHIRQEREYTARLGDIERLVPGSDHHQMENAGDMPAVTVHVFGDYPLKPRVYEDAEDGTFFLAVQNRRWEEIGD